jgi:hypothetical protein
MARTEWESRMWGVAPMPSLPAQFAQTIHMIVIGRCSTKARGEHKEEIMNMAPLFSCIRLYNGCRLRPLDR